ncbi:MAG: SAM-dependent methyltransferase, partial [Myxococcota bacterium]
APDSAEKRAIQKQAESDWAALVRRRRDELSPDGHLITVNLAADESGRYLGHNAQDLNMHDVLHDIWSGFRDDGTIDAAAYRRATFQNFYKRESQFVAPFAEGWRIHKVETKMVDCPYRARFEKDGHVERFASGLMRTVRSWSAHTFRGAIDGPESNDIVDRLYAEFERRIQSEPRRFSMDYVQNYLWAQKVD